jgi:hypothetical protein
MSTSEVRGLHLVHNHASGEWLQVPVFSAAYKNGPIRSISPLCFKRVSRVEGRGGVGGVCIGKDRQSPRTCGLCGPKAYKWLDMNALGKMRSRT